MEVCIKLAALQVLEIISRSPSLASKNCKQQLKAVLKQYNGLEAFFPQGLLCIVKRKMLKKNLLLQMESYQKLLPLPKQKTINSLQARLHYLKLVGDLPSYGGKVFSALVHKTAPVSSRVSAYAKFGPSSFLKGHCTFQKSPKEDWTCSSIYFPLNFNLHSHG